MSTGEACACSLRARLHQIEDARSREMEAHGSLVRKLECELETRRGNETELQHTVAKLRAEKFRIEAMRDAAEAKSHQILKTLEIQRIESLKREDEFQKFREGSKRQQRDDQYKISELMSETRKLSSELGKCTASLNSANHNIKILEVTNEEHTSRAKSQATAMKELLDRLAGMQSEIQAASVRSELTLSDLTTSREQQKLLHGEIQELERRMYRLVLSRNRAIYWRQNRQEMWEKQFLLQGTFLTWVSLFREEKGRSTVERHENTQAQLQGIKTDISRCSCKAKEILKSARQICTSERMRIVSVRNDVIKTEIPKVLELIETQKVAYESLQRTFESQIRTQQEVTDMERERHGMLNQDTEHCIKALKTALQTNFKLLRMQQRAILLVISTRKRREFNRRIFSCWKECYLRSTIGQAIHTAMIFRSQHPQLYNVNSFSSIVNHGELQFVPSAKKPHLRQQFNSDCSITSELSKPTDMMWVKWRRRGW
ncbi:uncharacterized protein PHALS_12958 [Plasmopara halstedii]|uniref:Uncharacterized protein n=1 Tax=Plasmopara halstedii TaxID=4781 RepID=A0A0P1ANW5_PLAHL|nr:uncharacterized protein PHALS_12958 [Plasmopara halstedii]CEG42705.1 hypothetical protein PHALS_12958 [Plasmopara halstedii]|eukprot:XP_024579074.1 hypothetical protein PHALS_12958 [Plasmopara halstedii]